MLILLLWLLKCTSLTRFTPKNFSYASLDVTQQHQLNKLFKGISGLGNIAFLEHENGKQKLEIQFRSNRIKIHWQHQVKCGAT